MPLDSVPVPPRLQRRPTDSRGYPIPYTVLIDETGKPDFRVTDVHAWAMAVRLRFCALCGQPMGRHLAFVGGPLSHDSRYFTDLPMHRDCAEYALQVCPFLAAPRFRYAAATPSETSGVKMTVNSAVDTTRPDAFFMGMTTGYAVVAGPGNTHLAKANPWEEVTWWRQGERLTERPAPSLTNQA
jgi:hypothetical protein